MPRHLARTTKGEQLVVSYMLLPNSTTNALVTKIDSIPQHVQRSLISLLDSPEAQRSEVLAEVLGRRTYQDSGKSMFQILHETNGLVSMSIDEILMTPSANTTVPLRQVLTAIGRIKDDKVTQQQANTGFNPHAHNQRAESAGENVGIARNLIIEAEMMESDARNKREQAYSMAPMLDPANATSKADAPASEGKETPADETN